MVFPHRPDLTEDELYDLFRDYGRIWRCDLRVGRGFGFVEFEHYRDADYALRKLDGSYSRRIPAADLRCAFWSHQSLFCRRFYCHAGSKYDGAYIVVDYARGSCTFPYRSQFERWLAGLHFWFSLAWHGSPRLIFFCIRY